MKHVAELGLLVSPHVACCVLRVACCRRAFAGQTSAEVRPAFAECLVGAVLPMYGVQYLLGSPQACITKVLE